jgi:hypothetical protein
MSFAELINGFYETLGRVLISKDFKLHDRDKTSKNNIVDMLLDKRKQRKLEQEVNIATAHIEKAQKNGYFEASVFVVPPNAKQGYVLYQFPMRSVFVMYGFKDRETDIEALKDPELEMLLEEEPKKCGRYTTQAKDDFKALDPEKKDKVVAELLQPYAFLGSTGYKAEQYHALIKKIFDSDMDISINKSRQIAEDICAVGPMANFADIFEYHFAQYDDLYE